MKSLVIGHQQRLGRFNLRETQKKAFNFIILFLWIFFQITGSHDREDGNAKGLVSAPAIRIERRKTKGKYIA